MNRLFAFVCFQLIAFGVLQAQEVLNDLEINPYLGELEEQIKPTHKSSNSTLTIPFIDDFSATSGHPNQELWKSRNVYINNHYAINPPSIGVATFDAVNEFGYVYESIDVATSPADTLTSQVIDLSSADRESTYLSFYFQPQGLGNQPENKDSLVLNFISRDSVFRAWHVNGTSFFTFINNTFGIDTTKNLRDTLMFQRVHLKLDDDYFFSDSFQLQFINYANVPSVATRPSGRTNSDHWHIDYVKLDDGRSDEEYFEPDMAMVEPPSIFMKDYSSLPWKHYDVAITKQAKDISYNVRNNDQILRSMDGIVMNITNTKSGDFIDFYYGQENFDAFVNKEIDENFDDPVYFPYDANLDSASFEISGRLEADKNYDYEPNNYAARVVHFKDYYAYDDGTAEKTYGIDADRAKVAYRYHNYKGDSLKAVQMYFVRNKEEYAGVQNFTFCVWKDYNGEPGELLYAETGIRPVIKDKLNEFVTLELDTALFIEEGNYFIGWKQNSDLLMSVGYDANTIRRNRIFFYVQSQWYPSEYSGSLMMRPVFGERDFPAPEKAATLELEIKPNPSFGQISILNFDSEEMNGQIHVFDFMGKKLFEQNASTAEMIDLSHLNSGMYIISFFPSNAKPRSTRLIISK